MITIVQYTDGIRPTQRWPRRIVSPTHASPCCQQHMRAVGHPHPAPRWSFQYKVCARCGFAVRVIVCPAVDPELVASLRRSFERNLTRGYYDQ